MQNEKRDWFCQFHEQYLKTADPNMVAIIFTQTQQSNINRLKPRGNYAYQHV